jgi:hypothetical protein
MLPTASQLELGGLCVAHLFSISFILSDSKLCGSRTLNIPVAEGKLTTHHHAQRRTQ